MKSWSKEGAVDRMNELAKSNIPYIFVISYDGTKAYVEPLSEVNPDEMMYCFGGECNVPSDAMADNGEIKWCFERPDRGRYHRAFETVADNIRAGNSYLVNLTCRVPVTTSLSARDIFLRSAARYRLWIRNQLVCFSPEIFIRLKDGKISSFPMKGTIDASTPDAEQRLMDDAKEAAEHATIVDLIRNDLSMVADGVRVARYRYVERLSTNRGAILQTSSEICGNALPFYRERPGDLLARQLPAGSVTGAPKPKTQDIIEEAEGYDRGFYTGVMGIWKDGEIDSAVMIRFVDEEDGRLYYKAGGGITAGSEEDKEYDEIIEKIYVPVY